MINLLSMHTQNLYLGLLLSALTWCHEQVQPPGLEAYFPTVSGELVQHSFYTLDYSEEHEQANWVIYFAGVSGSADRSDNFRADPLVSTESASLDDYKASGYDRGHLAPAADMSASPASMSESFFLSNMSPQAPSFNRGIWKKLEALVRNWALAAESPSDVIVTGPVLTQKCGEIGEGVTVPCAYYKIYLDMSQKKAIGFLLPNEASQADLSSFARTIDEIEATTGIDFFQAFEDELEVTLESTLNAESWDWKIKDVEIEENDITEEPSEVQCQGITQSGTQCSRNAGASGYCWQHE